MGCALKISVFIASSPWNLAKDLQGRYAAPFLHTTSNQKLEVGGKTWEQGMCDRGVNIMPA